MDTIEIEFSNNPIGQKTANFVDKRSIHLTVVPHTIMEDGGKLKNYGFEVSFWRDRGGKPDFESPLNSNVVPGGEDDLEEIADTYANRLNSGINPEKMFDDIIEMNSRLASRT